MILADSLLFVSFSCLFKLGKTTSENNIPRKDLLPFLLGCIISAQNYNIHEETSLAYVKKQTNTINKLENHSF